MKTINSPRTTASFEQVVHRILASGKITPADAHFLLKATLHVSAMSQEEQLLVTRIHDRMRMGLVKVVA